jgi:hypothetical protein
MLYCRLDMLDKKGQLRLKCHKGDCDCDEYTREKGFDLCAYCEHSPVVHGKLVFGLFC